MASDSMGRSDPSCGAYSGPPEIRRAYLAGDKPMVRVIGILPNGIGEVIGDFAGDVKDVEGILWRLVRDRDLTVYRWDGTHHFRVTHTHSEIRRLYTVDDDGSMDYERRLLPDVHGSD